MADLMAAVIYGSHHLWHFVTTLEGQLKAGDILLFDGDIVHRTHGWLHVYLHVCGVEHEHNAQRYISRTIVTC